MSSRRNPFQEIERMFERMSRQLEEATRSWDAGQPALPGAGGSTLGVDVADRGDTFVVTADVPGFEKEEIDVTLTDTSLHIHAEKAGEEEVREENYIRNERSRRSIDRTVSLPEPVNEEDVSASYRNGVLTVTLSKREPSEGGRSIDIE